MQICVVGGGIIGCAVAFELASRGASVHVIDPRGTGLGATYASAGILAPRIEGHTSALLELALSGLAAYDDFIARVRAESTHPVEYMRTGTLHVALTHAEAETLRQDAAAMAAADVKHTLLAGPEAMRLEPSLSADVHAALLVPEHGYVAVGPMANALAAAAIKRGVQFSTGSVTGIDSRAGGVSLDTSAGRITCDAVVIAAGTWSPDVLGTEVSPRPVKPIRGQLIQLVATAPPASRVVWGTKCYVVPWQDGSVLVGATVEDVGFDESATAGGVKALLDAAVDLLPDVAAAKFGQVRVGLRPRTVDELPAIGPSSTMPQVFYATGHYRNGVLLAPLTALMVAGLIVDSDPHALLALTSPARLGL